MSQLPTGDVVDYGSYIKSSAWRAVRARYIASGLPKVCYVCGAQWGRGGHLHHRTYKNLGRERLMDLVPLCPGCHRDVHDFDRTHPSAPGKGLWWSTKQVRKRRQRSDRPSDDHGRHSL